MTGLSSRSVFAEYLNGRLLQCLGWVWNRPIRCLRSSEPTHMRGGEVSHETASLEYPERTN